MFTAPTAIRAIKKEDPEGDFIKKYDLSSLKTQYLAGERCDIATLNGIQNTFPFLRSTIGGKTESGQ
jgi:propionyl-CoA synthetase